MATISATELQQFAERLMGADAEERAALLQAPAAPIGVALAYTIKDISDATWASDPTRAAGAAAALADLVALFPDPEVRALAAWTAGIAALTQGAPEHALRQLDHAAEAFSRLGKAHPAASTQVSKLIALALLGRYDEASTCGMQARDAFLALDDLLAAGKIEQNLGGIAWRRERYQEAERFHRAARERFATAGAVELLVAADNALAADLASQFRLREAAERYADALRRAEQAGLELRQAEIEGNLGNLALAQGRYDEALDYLECSRRRYAALGMPHETAFAEQELAEAYLDLNMAAEAAAIYARVTPTFAALGLRAEQAWALAHYGQAAVVLGHYDEAMARFAQAHRLFVEEDNPISAALVTLFEAQLAYQRGDYATSLAAAAASEPVLSHAGNHGRAMLARWLQGEALRALGRLDDARRLLETVWHDAERYALPQVAQRAQTSLGLIAAASGDLQRAEAALLHAVTIIEELRAPLPSEELRTAFVADKLGPYDALLRLCLTAAPPRVAEALGYAERARARALAEMLGRAVQTLGQPRDPFEAGLFARLTELREELNWLYTQLNQALAGAGPGPAAQAELQAAAYAREAAILELSRQVQLRGGALPGMAEPLDLPALQQALGPESALVAYYGLEGELLAFIVTDTTIEVVRHLGAEAAIEALVSQLRFQIDALQRGARTSTAHSDQLLRRARHYLAQLHGLLLAPLEPHLGPRRLVVVPHRALHYVPFHALYDGEQYVIECRDVCTTPSASVLQRCLARPRRPQRRAVLLGYPDQRAPRVRDEVLALAALFPDHVLLLDDTARAAELRRYAPEADILHLACHGSFRPDSPLFSALHLADGRFTTRDAYSLDLRCELVVLSACETGVSRVAPGDELIGLARGFFAAGAPALLVSLWTVDDASTAELMTRLYLRLREGDTPSQALRAAQCALLRDRPHPFFWAPFVLMGRW